MNSKYMDQSAEIDSSLYTEEEASFYVNFKQHQVSAYSHKMYDSDSRKRDYIQNKQNELIQVSKKYFDTHKQFVKKITFQDGVRYYSVSYREKKPTHKPQGIINTLLAIPGFIKDVVEKVKAVKTTIAETSSAQVNAFVIDFAALIADMWGYHTCAAWGILLCRIYSLILRAVDFSNYILYRPQSFADFSLMVAMLGLPKDLIEKLRVFQTLVTSKLTSSTWLLAVFRQFVHLIQDFIIYIKGKYPNNGVVLAIEKFVLDQFSFVLNLEEAEKISKLYSRYVKNSQIMFDIQYRQEVIEKESVLSNESFMSFLNNPEFKHFKEIVTAFKSNVIRYAKTFTVSSRSEPVCFVLEGPAGCRKSAFMNQIVQLCKADNKSVYSHNIPSVEDSKDFYDDYENQDVFVMDDLGQQGLSQWRTIINFVSPVKLPLNCAAAEKKNTKFFNSELILATTNLFSNIQSFTAKDCITSKEALFRRVHLIKFEGNNGQYTLTYNKFNYSQNNPQWEQRFIDLLKDVQLPVSVRVNVDDEVSVKDALVWMYSIIKSADIKNKEVSNLSSLKDDSIQQMLDRVNDNVAFYDAQMVRFNALVEDNQPGQLEYSTTNVHAVSEESYYSSFMNFLTKKVVESFNWWYDKAFASDLTSSFIAGGIVALLLLSAWYIGDKIVSNIKSLFCTSEFVDCTYSIQALLGAEDLNDNQTRVRRNHQFVVKCTSEIGGNRVEQAAVCFMTGNYLLVNDHLVGNNPVFNIYKDFNAMLNNHVLFNNLPFTVVRRFKDEDICVCKCEKFTVTPVKVYGDYVRYVSSIRDTDKCMYVSNPSFIIPLVNKVNCKQGVTTISYRNDDTVYKMKAEDIIKYDLTQSGLCFSILMDHNGNPCGHHVCGNDKEGVLKVWGKEFLSYFLQLNKNADIVAGKFEYSIKETLKENFSGLRVFHTDLTPSQSHGKTSIKESDLFSIREEVSDELVKLCEQKVIGPPVLKKPANLNVYGNETVIKLAEKSFKCIPQIDPKHLSYVKECLSFLLPEKFSKIDENVAAFGGDGLNPMKKDSANGYGYSKNKEDYLDYENKEITSKFREKIDKFKQAVLSNTTTIDMLLCKEALKDELRTEEKSNKPRTFRVLPLHHTFLVKQYLGELFTYLKDRMWENGIAIGMNPYLDFERLYKRLVCMPVVFDGDFGSYDGSAPSQLQDLIAELVLERFEGSADDRKILSVLLNSMIRSWVLTREKLTLTTHSMPSGCWVTALFNSLLNRALTALCISMFSPRKPTVGDFISVEDFVLGDDKIVGVPMRLGEIVNAVNMRKVAESLGMTYTDALKGEIVEKSKPLFECQFLKRTFSFNRDLNKVVGVLDMNTLIETLRYYSGARVYEEVMNGKMTAIQFEMFLYGPAVEPLLNKIKTLARMHGIEFQEFPKSVIMKTMLDSDAYSIVLEALEKYNFLV